MLIKCIVSGAYSGLYKFASGRPFASSPPHNEKYLVRLFQALNIAEQQAEPHDYPRFQDNNGQTLHIAEQPLLPMHQHTRNEGDKEPSLSDMEVWLDDSESEVERILYPVGDDHNRNSIMQCST